MKIYFGCHTRDLDEFHQNHREIREILLELNNEFTHDWLGEVVHGTQKDLNMKIWYQKIMKSLISADVAIFDISRPSLSLGHQIAFALDNKIPTLLVAQKSEQNIQDSFISGAISESLISISYSKTFELKPKLKKFIESIEAKKMGRVNFLLEKKYLDYLNWSKTIKNRSLTDSIRQGLDALMSKDNF